MSSPISNKLLFFICVGFALSVGLTTLASPDIYSSWWWFYVWGGVAILLSYSVFKRKLWRDKPLFILHVSLIFILAGGGLTRLTAKKGTIHLEPQKTYTNYIAYNGSESSLPFSIKLLEFHTDYYPGMSFPRNFQSSLLIDNNDTVCISMNKIGEVKHFRLYQSSFDGKGGSILSVCWDPWGIAVTYTGYILFIFSGLIYLLRQLNIRNKKYLTCILLALFIANTAEAAPAVEKSMSDSIGQKQIVFNGRTISFARMSSELTLKLTGKTHVGILDPTQFITSLVVYPQEWKNVAFLKVKCKELRDSLNLINQYVSVSQLYDQTGQYKLQHLYSEGNKTLDSEILKLDEKVAILDQIWRGTAFQPIESNNKTKSIFIVDSEILYFRILPLRICFIVVICLAIIGFICIGLCRFSIFIRWSSVISFIITSGVFLWKWIIDCEIPLNTSSDILNFIALCMSLFLIPISKRYTLGANIGLISVGFLLLMSWIASKDPTLTPLLPVLSSPWLGAHVSVIMASYALLGLTFPLSIVAIVFVKQRCKLNTLSNRLLFPGVYMLGVGIILGAMWANVSWGRYWAWDPKETWALVTMILYAIPLHKSLSVSKKQLSFSIYLTVAFLSILMTYAGVNYLSSLHAYR